MVFHISIFLSNIFLNSNGIMLLKNLHFMGHHLILLHNLVKDSINLRTFFIKLIGDLKDLLI